VDQVNYTAQKAWKVYTSLVRPVLYLGLHAGIHAEDR